jgi:hypothetical protein
LGIHLLQAEKEEDMENAILAGINREINPRDDHISFQVRHSQAQVINIVRSESWMLIIGASELKRSEIAERSKKTLGTSSSSVRYVAV